MNLFDLFIKIGVDDQATDHINNLSSSLGTGLKTAAKIGTAAVGAATAGIVTLTKDAVDNYSEYEQLVGGVDTLFKESSYMLQNYADDAYTTAGMSANEYMDTVTSFSASLLQSLEWDTEAAVEYANMAITDMSDNANKMGTSMSMIQNAYQGFAKQNYTMLDNLKLGYGGTASEMYRLLETAAELDETFAKTAEFSIDSKGHLSAEFADIVEAIHIVQEEMGITGTTAQEAGTTIQGSVSSMRAAYKNLITGLATDNADIEQLTKNLVTTVFGDGTETNLGVFNNVAPAVETALGSISTLVTTSGGMVGDLLLTVGDYAPRFVDTAVELVDSFVTGLSENEESKQRIVEGVFGIADTLAGGFAEIVPDVLALGGDITLDIIEGMTSPEVLYGFDAAAEKMVDAIVDSFDSERTKEVLKNAAVNLGSFAATQIKEFMVGQLETAVEFTEDIVDLIDGAFPGSRYLFEDGFEDVNTTYGDYGDTGYYDAEGEEMISPYNGKSYVRGSEWEGPPSMTTSGMSGLIVNQYINTNADATPSELMGEALYQQKLAVMSGVSY